MVILSMIFSDHPNSSQTAVVFVKTREVISNFSIILEMMCHGKLFVIFL